MCTETFHRHRPAIIVLTGLLLLSGCSLFGTPETAIPEEAVEETSLPPVQDQTPNVSYRGLLSAVDRTITMEGSHMLTLYDGRSLLLESDVIALNDFIGREVEVMGAVHSTDAGGGLIMRVTVVTDIAPSSSSSETASVVTEDQDASSVVSSLAASAVPVQVSSSSKSVQPLVISTASSIQASSASSVADGDEDASRAELEARTAVMAKAKVDEANWTQKYCTGHIGFCMPVHKNWWYKSFGAFVGPLWYVELSSSEIETKGHGPISVSLLKGDAGPEDGKVLPQGDYVLGVLSWTEGRHFEIKAPAALQSAVEYILQHITPYSDSSSSAT